MKSLLPKMSKKKLEKEEDNFEKRTHSRFGKDMRYLQISN